MNTTIFIDYTNHRGERAFRTVRPIDFYFGWTEWHPKPQWLMKAHDLEKDAYREFAMDQIHSWRQG